jgi:hypothetical protein
VHRKLKQAMRTETSRWVDKENLEKTMDNVKTFFFEYWASVMQG